MSWTAIITAYARPHTLKDQVRAIQNQSIPPDEVWVWHNYYPNVHLDSLDGITIIRSEKNFKYCARFALAMLVQTEYVGLFDDDTIPGREWARNCIDCIKQQDGIYGSAGVRLLNPFSYDPHERVGWPVPNNDIEEVDLVGHAWFFRSEYTKYMWYNRPMLENGEDIHFSAMCQIHGGINTYVPPHPPNQRELWGSLYGNELGIDAVASSHPSNHGKFYRERDRCIQRCQKLGWKPMCTRS